PSGLTATARKAEAIAKEVQAENALLVTEAQLQLAVEEVLDARVHDLEEKLQHQQAAQRQLRLENEYLEAVVKQQELAMTTTKRAQHRLEAQLRKYQRQPQLTRRQQQLRKEVRREEAAAAMARQIAKAEMKAAAATHRVGQVVVDVGDHEGQHRLSAAYALTYDGRDYSHITVEEAQKLSVRELQAYLRFHQQEVMKGWLKPKLKGLVMAHIRTLAGLHGDEQGAASSVGTSLEASLRHITVTLATWDAVWEEYLDPKWAWQRLRLYGAQDRALEQFIKKARLEEDMAELSMKRHKRAKQLVVFFGAASIGTQGGWGADAVLRACCKVVCRPRGTDQRRGRVVLVDEHRTSWVSSAVNGKQPSWSQQREQPVRGLMWCPVVAPRIPPQPHCSSQEATQPAASEPGSNTPPPTKRSKHTKAEQAPETTQPTKDKGKDKGKAAKFKATPQPGR
ncbi:hypothetical protein QJQ45_029449, partial [Haematococcus lacustris]